MQTMEQNNNPSSLPPAPTASKAWIISSWVSVSAFDVCIIYWLIDTHKGNYSFTFFALVAIFVFLGVFSIYHNRKRLTQPRWIKFRFFSGIVGILIFTAWRLFFVCPGLCPCNATSTTAGMATQCPGKVLTTPVSTQPATSK